MKRLLVPALLAVGCASAPAPAPAPSTPAPKLAAAPTPPPTPAGLDAAAIDPSVNPCDDFYQFACGGWLRATPIPPDRSKWGRGFNVIEERNQQILKEILEAVAEGKAPQGTPYARQLGDFYATCMDESKLGNALPELRTAIRRIDRVGTSKQVATEVARLHDDGARALFGYGSGQDA